MIVQKFQSSQAYHCHTTAGDVAAGDVASTEFCAENTMTNKHEKHEENNFTVDTQVLEQGPFFTCSLFFKLYKNIVVSFQTDGEINR